MALHSAKYERPSILGEGVEVAERGDHHLGDAIDGDTRGSCFCVMVGQPLA
jgi:hypothetical protein